MRKIIAAGLVGLMLGPTAPLVTGLAHAGCTGSLLQHNWRCDCNPGFYWNANECQPTQAWIDAHMPSGPVPHLDPHDIPGYVPFPGEPGY